MKPSFSLHSLQAVESGRLDFAFVSWTKRPVSLRFIEVRDDPFAVVGLKSRFAHITKVRSIEELRNEPWFFHPKPQEDWLAALESDRQGLVPRDPHCIRSIVLSGAAIGDAQLLLFSKKEREKLAIAPITTFYHPPKIYAVHLPQIGAEARERMHQLIELIRAAP